MSADLPAPTSAPGAVAEPPAVRPPLGSWGRTYALVLGALALEIVLLRLLTVTAW